MRSRVYPYMRQKQVKFTQVSLFSVLLSGRYGGVISVGELKKLGNMAIATMDRLDGEMQMIDGVVYQACADGRVYMPNDDATIPFGTVAEFHADHTLKLSDIPSYEIFETRIDELCQEENIPLAIHFTGDFRHMKVRAVARQERDGIGLATFAAIWSDSGCPDMSKALMLQAGTSTSWMPKGVAAAMWSTFRCAMANCGIATQATFRFGCPIRQRFRD